MHDLQSNQRSRWLIEAAVAELVDVGLERVAQPPPSTTAPLATTGGPSQVRNLALSALRDLLEQDSLPFEQFLECAAREYILVVLLPARQPRVFLRWDAPLLPAERPGAEGRTRRLMRATLPVNREFTVEYATSIPRAVGSYHLTLEVSEEIHVRRFLLSSNVDDPFVNELDADLCSLSAKLADFDLTETSGRRSAETKLAELELQSVASRIAAVSRRRQLDLQSYEAYITSASERFGFAMTCDPLQRLDPETALDQLRRGEWTLAALTSFALAFANGGYTRLAGTLTGPDLERIVEGLRSSQVGRDVTTDNDPREHGAHAHWRQPTKDLTPRSSEPVQAVAYVALADEAPALIESITRMIIGLVIVVLGIGSLLSRGVSWVAPWTWDDASHLLEVPQQADAVVAVLLLVPGLMLARLDLPSTNTVLGQLRRSQRAMATLSVCVTTALAMVVGTVKSPEWLTVWFWLSALTLIALAAMCGVELLFRRQRRRGSVPHSEAVPAWLRGYFEHWPTVPEVADASFHSGSP